MLSWHLMNFSQTESKVRLHCSLRSRHRKDQGLRGGSILPFCPPLKSPQEPLSKALLNLHFAGCSTYLWCSHRERKLGPHSRVQVSPHPWIQGSPTPESR